MASFLGVLALATGVPAHGQLGAEIARRHAERAGAQLRELRALYSEGQMLVGDEVVRFRTWAERPDRLRVETVAGERRVIQCFDGRQEPWLSHSEIREGVPQRMRPADARDFIGNADFDGPLVDPARKGLTVDYAGEESVAGRRAFKLLVMNSRDEVFFYWVDAGTHDIVKRAVYRQLEGRRTTVETFFGDHRPVGGVPQPHRIETRAGDRVLYVMEIDRMEANPADWPRDLFAAPAGWPPIRRPEADDTGANAGRPGAGR